MFNEEGRGERFKGDLEFQKTSPTGSEYVAEDVNRGIYREIYSEGHGHGQ